MDSGNEVKKQTKKELFISFEKLRKEINSSRNELNRINDQKESWFRKKADLSDTTRKKIAQIKENKKKRDSLTKNVKELKEKRNKLAGETGKKISELKKLKSGLKNLEKTSKIRDPLRIKRDMDKIEIKLETEAMSFEKEKELSKKLKLLKKLFGEASVIINVLNKIKKLNSEIDASKKNTNMVHNEIQKVAAESQELHEGVIKTSKEIDELEIKEEEAFKNFINLKKNFNSLNTGLEKNLGEISGVMEKINKFKLEEDEKKKLEESMLIKSKEQEIEEKIKTGKKLTTDDFLAFQEIIKDKK